MKIKILFLSILILFIFLLVSLSSPKKYFFQQGFKNMMSIGGARNILLLGKPGFGYNGGENTDSLILLNIEGNSAFLIYIPRDLILKNNNEQYKINSLIALSKEKELLREVEKVTGLSVNSYIEYDLYLARKIIDSVGGIDVRLSSPVVDAVSGFALYSGSHHLNGEMAEFVLRSRYARDGDFFRMKNQFEVIRALKQKVQSLPREDVLKLIKVLNANNRHYQTNLNPLDLLGFLADMEKVDFGKTKKIILGFETKLWVDGSYKISLGKGYSGRAYGLVPKEGIGQYGEIRNYINNEKYKSTTEELKNTFEKTKSGIEKEFNFGKRN